MITALQSLSPSSVVDSRGHSSPSMHSPYQQAPNSSMLHSPAYPSPARSDTEPSRYAAEGLGLYQYSQPFPSSAGPSGSVLFSPSPQVTGAWNGTSTMTPAPIVNPWTSGAYDHPVCPDPRSPMLWPHYHASHRSSTSSQRAMSVFSGDGSENTFPHIKLEGGSGWTTDEDLSPSATVAPHRLTASSVMPYDGVYGSPLSHYDSDNTPGPDFKGHYLSQFSPGARPTSSQSDTKASVPRERRRRTRSSNETARFRCEICDLGFVRSYNKKTHMQRHDPNRAKDHACPHEGCDKKFERKTDLDRHNTSIHLKLKGWECKPCGKRFARKDTLRRHRHIDQGGCPKRNQVEIPALLARSRSMQQNVPHPQAYYPSPPRPEQYAGFPSAEGVHGLFGSRHQHVGDEGGFDGRFALFKDEGFGGNIHGL